MINAYKILGQVIGSAYNEVLAYKVPLLTKAVISTAMICNLDSVEHYFRVSVHEDDSLTEEKNFVYYDIPVPANETYSFTIGMTLSAGNEVRFYVDSDLVSFNLFGQESSYNSGDPFLISSLISDDDDNGIVLGSDGKLYTELLPTEYATKTSQSPGIRGQRAYDDDYEYLCTTTGEAGFAVWKKKPLLTVL